MSDRDPHFVRRCAWVLGFTFVTSASLCRAQLVTKPPTEAQFREATKAAVAQGNWSAQQEFLDQAMLNLVKTLPAHSDAQRYDSVFSEPKTSVVLAQAELIRRIFGEKLAAAAKACGDPAFLEWMLTDAGAMEALLIALTPEDDPVKVFQIWSRLWKCDDDSSHEYRNLALACALVFDAPPKVLFTRKPAIKPIDVEKRYKFFRDAAKNNKLDADLRAIPVWELVWVVDAPVPEDELAWAQTRINVSRDRWGETYSMVKYRMDMVTGGKSPYGEYTLEEILKKGGICVDQSYFAAITAKANGIPAMPIRGDGQRGGHAWFGYKASSKEWNMTAGRYTADDYATGTTIDPQTGKQIKEQALYLMADEQRRAPGYLTAWRLLWLSHVAASRAGDSGLEGALLKLALATSSRHTQAWMAYTDYLARVKADADTWKQCVKTMRAAFRNYPDMLAQIDQIERDMVLTAGGSDAVAKHLKSQTKKLAHDKEGRTDLLLDSIDKQAEVLEESGNTNAVVDLYRKALNTYGQDVVAFQTLACQYFGVALNGGKAKEALRNIESAYKHYHCAYSGDYFAMKTRAGLLDMIAGFYEEAGQNKDAAKARKEADKLRKLAQASQGKD